VVAVPKLTRYDTVSRVTDFAVITRRDEPGTIALEVVGDLDLSTAPEMLAAGQAALDQPDCSVVTLDVGGVAFIDSTGIGTWVQLRNQAIELGQRLQLRAVSANVLRILEMGGLGDLLAAGDTR
jgi:anti-anti-sigma factor